MNTYRIRLDVGVIVTIESTDEDTALSDAWDGLLVDHVDTPRTTISDLLLIDRDRDS